MTREEAIKVLEKQFDKSCGNYRYQNAEKLDFEDALWMAISALRQQETVTNRNGLNEPLTLDELRQMDGKPVWCEIYIKGQPSFYGIVHGENVTGFIPGDDKPANLAITNVGAYGLAWLAYRQKPEEDDHDERKENENV